MHVITYPCWGDLNLLWILGNSHCIVGSYDLWKFLLFSKGHWQFLNKPDGRQITCLQRCARRLWKSLELLKYWHTSPRPVVLSKCKGPLCHLDIWLSCRLLWQQNKNNIFLSLWNSFTLRWFKSLWDVFAAGLNTLWAGGIDWVLLSSRQLVSQKNAACWYDFMAAADQYPLYGPFRKMKGLNGKINLSWKQQYRYVPKARHWFVLRWRSLLGRSRVFRG